MSEVLKGRSSAFPEYRGFYPDLDRELMEDIYTNAPLGELMGEHAMELQSIFTPVRSAEQILVDNRVITNTPSINARIDQIKKDTGFKPAHGRWEYAKEMARFAITRNDEHRTYAQILKSHEDKTSLSESATFGFANFNGEPAVLFASHFRFIGGSVGVVAGEKMLAACMLAKKNDLSLVVVPTTGGMRQHENFFSVSQMPRGVAGINWLRETSDLPIIMALLGPVFGGTSASIVPLGDVIIGVKGGSSGFAGGRVIGAYQGWMPDPGSQSVETNYLDRNVDVLVDESELVDYTAHFLKVAKSRTKLNKDSQIPDTVRQEIWDLKHMREGAKRKLFVPKDGFAPALYSNQELSENVTEIIEYPDAKEVKTQSTDENDLFENYMRIVSDIGRPDGEFLVQQIFDEVVPMYNKAVVGDKIIYPPICTGFGRIDNQPFFLAWDQPSKEIKRYTIGGKEDVSIKKISATPRPVDFDRFKELMELASRRGIPVITFVDTLGAEPTIDAERRGQSKRIAFAIESLINHSKPVVSVIIGGLGSGGGIALTSLAPKFLAFDNSQLWVAEPKSAAAILYGTDNPTEAQVKEVLKGFECTPFELQKHGFPIDIVTTNTNPFITARNTREKILSTYSEQMNLSETKLRKLRQKTLAKLGTQALRLVN